MADIRLPRLITIRGAHHHASARPADDVVVGPHLSDEEERDGVGEIGGPERAEAVQVRVIGGWLISRTSRVMVIAKTASETATSRAGSRCTDGASAPALPPGARAV